MGSLTAHLLDDGDHGRLGFHPRCPVCRRERLFGSLLTEPVVSRRVQAALAAAALAFSAAAPGVTAAQEPDQQQEGVAAPDQGVGVAPNQEPSEGAADEPTFDPGGDTALPFEGESPEPAPPTDEEANYTAPVEPEPVHDPYADYLAPDEPEPEAPTDEDAPPPPVDPAPGEPATPVPAESPDTEADTPPTSEDPGTADSPPDPDSPTTPNPEDGTGSKPDRNQGTEPDERSLGLAPAPQEAPVAPPPPPMPSPTSSGTSPSSVSTSLASDSVVRERASAPTGRGSRPRPNGARFHVVQAGESLWSIAKKLLGASATSAQIAREVNRLWELNRDRIGSGNPDLLMVGEKLRLR